MHNDLECAGVSCNGVKDDTSGSIVSVQRYLAWNAVANLNNYLYALYEALFNAGTLNGLLDGKIVTTFFTNPSPDATWMQILNTFTPLITIFSAMLGPFVRNQGPILDEQTDTDHLPSQREVVLYLGSSAVSLVASAQEAC